MYKMIEEIVEVLPQLKKDDYVSDRDCDFISDLADKVAKTGHMTAFTDKQAHHIHRIYQAACNSPY